MGIVFADPDGALAVRAGIVFVSRLEQTRRIDGNRYSWFRALPRSDRTPGR